MSELPTALKTACTSGDLPLTTSLYNTLESSTKPAALTQMAVLAAKANQPKILSYCFSEGLVLKSDTVDTRKVVGEACSSGSVAVFEVLLENGLNINESLETEGDPLTWACYTGNTELASFLLRRGADPNTDHIVGDSIALTWAVIGDKGSPELVKELLDYGAKVKETGALIAAAEYGNLAAVKMFINNKDVDLEEVEFYDDYDSRKLDDMGTALYKAAAKGRRDVVAVLLEAGADISFKDRMGRSVLDIAEANGHRDMMKDLPVGQV